MLDRVKWCHGHKLLGSPNLFRKTLNFRPLVPFLQREEFVVVGVGVGVFIVVVVVFVVVIIAGHKNLTLNWDNTK